MSSKSNKKKKKFVEKIEEDFTETRRANEIDQQSSTPIFNNSVNPNRQEKKSNMIQTGT